MESVVKLVDVCRRYGAGENAVHALSNVSVEIKKGEFVAVVGASGSGKSTFLNVCGGLDIPTSGEVIVGGKKLAGLGADELTEFRRKHIGFVFQNYNLIPVMTVKENIVLPVQIGGKMEDGELYNRVVNALGLAGLENRLPSELSGGQQQRVAIGRALITRPALILADEPTGNLDSQNSSEVIALLREASRKYEQTIIMITHNRSIAQTADRVLQVSDGCLTDLGRCRE